MKTNIAHLCRVALLGLAVLLLARIALDDVPTWFVLLIGGLT